MVIAALASFGILIVAWILAPDEGSRRPQASTVPTREPVPATT